MPHLDEVEQAEGPPKHAVGCDAVDDGMRVRVGPRSERPEARTIATRGSALVIISCAPAAGARRQGRLRRSRRCSDRQRRRERHAGRPSLQDEGGGVLRGEAGARLVRVKEAEV